MGALTFVRADPGNILGSDPRHRPFRPRSPAQVRVAGRAVVGCGEGKASQLVSIALSFAQRLRCVRPRHLYFWVATEE